MPLADGGGKHTIPPANPSVSLPLKTKHFLASFGRKRISLSQIDVERRRHCFALSLSLQTLKLVYRATELPVQVSFVAQEFCGD
jgi:hypothetical protein